MKRQNFFNEIISIENLYLAWSEFVKGKKWKKDVMEFSLHLSENVYSLHRDLEEKVYTHGGYTAFNISDPKPRNIHKATVRDRLLHHAIYRVLYPYFDSRFIHDSYSCRKWKGTHRAINRFRDFGRKVSKNNTRQCWILKCDVRKFFASIDQAVLIEILISHRLDNDTVWLLEKVITSFKTQEGKGLPLGNLTSQLLVNIYMNEFDQYVKHGLKTKHYVRYADDFIVLSQDRHELLSLLKQIKQFLEDKLKLTLHPDKIHIRTLFSGIDFLGWVHFPHHRVLRTVTKRRMFRNLKNNQNKKTIQSYLGLLSHGDAYEFNKTISMIL